MTVRWHVKKVARAAMALAATCSGALAVTNSFRAPRVRVLTYHRFGQASSDPFSVDRNQFERQMEWIARHDLAISLSDLLAFIAGKKTLRDGAVLVTIDDGYQDLLAVLPVLERFGIPAVAFIPAADVQGVASASQGETGSKLIAREVNALHRRGVEVGSHGWSHRSLGTLGVEEVKFEANQSKVALEGIVAGTVRAFAYPYGTRLDYNASTGFLLMSSGYDCSFTSQHGSIGTGADPICLPRIKIEGGDPDWLFKLAVKGGLDWWAAVDRFASGFQATPATAAARTRRGVARQRGVGARHGGTAPVVGAGTTGERLPL